MFQVMRVVAAVGALGAVGLAGCGSSSSETTVDDAGNAGAKKLTADLTIVVTDGSEKEHEFKVSCDPDGDAAANSEKCADLSGYYPGIFDETASADEVCAEVFAGPETATVSGTVDGKDVSGTFNRSDTCQDARWKFITDMTGFSVAEDDAT